MMISSQLLQSVKLHILFFSLFLFTVGIFSNVTDAEAVNLLFVEPPDIGQVPGTVIETDIAGNIYYVNFGTLTKIDSLGNIIWESGSRGSAEGQIRSASGMTVDDVTGDIYVSDRSLSRISVFDSSGIFLYSFGPELLPDGIFNPFGLAIHSGTLYVTESFFTNSERVSVFDLSTIPPTFDQSFGTFGTGNGQFSLAWDIDVDSQGRIYTIELGNDRIQIFDTDFNHILTFFGDEVDPQGDWSNPHSFALGQDGTIFVADRDNARALVFSAFDGINPPVLLSIIGSPGTGVGQFQQPLGLHATGTESSFLIYVADPRSNRIQIFDQDDVVKLTIGTDFSQPGRYLSSGQMSTDASENIYLADTFNHRIQKFDSDGIFVDTFGSLGTSPGQFDSPSDVFVDTTGLLYVSDQENHRIQVFDSAFQHELTIGSFGRPSISSTCNTDAPGAVAPCDGQFWDPQGVLVNNQGNVFVADTFNDRIQKFDLSGNFVSKFGSTCTLSTGVGCVDPDGAGPLELGDGQFRLASRIAVDSNDNLYLIDAVNNRILIFDSNGVFLQKFVSDRFGQPEHSLFDSEIAIDNSDKIYISVTGSTASQVQVFSPFDGVNPPTPFTQFGSLGVNPCSVTASGLAFGNSDEIYLASNFQLVKFGPTFSSTGDVMFNDENDDSFEINHAGSVSITDASADITPGQDVICALVTSDTDPAGISVSLLESEQAPGQFEMLNLIQFTSAITNSDTNALSVAVGATVTAKYQTITDTSSIVTADNTPVGDDPVNTADIFSCGFSGGDNTDGDGLCSNWEQGTSGLIIDDSFLTLDPPFGIGVALDAPVTIDCESPICPAPGIQDIYVEVDYMEGHEPDPQAIADVVDAFLTAPTPINLHVIIDDEIPHTDVIFFDEFGQTPVASHFDTIKAQWFGTSEDRERDDFTAVKEVKRQFMRYALFVHDVDSALHDPGVSGIAEQHGNDFIVSLGQFTNGVGSVNQQSGTFMHELGHTINLNHGGPDVHGDADNCKPNYLSVMNYAYQLPDFLPERPLTYSSASSTLSESNLNDVSGFNTGDPDWPRIAYGTPNGVHRDLSDGTEIDWNDDDVINSGNFDINNFGIADCDGSGSDLKSYDDWSAIEIDFKTETTNFNDGLHVFSLTAAPEIAIENIIEIREDAVEQQNQQIQGLDDAAFAPGVDPVQTKQDLANSLDELSTLSTSTDSNDLESASQLAAEIQQTITNTIDDVTVQQELLDQLGDLAMTAEDSANAGESIHATPDTLYAQKSSTITQLAALIDTSDSKTIKKIEKATKRIQKSLNTDFWNADADTLTQEFGKKVFNKEKRAVKELMKIKNPDAQIQIVIDTLILVDQTLAQNAIDDAISNPDANSKQIEKAQKAMTKAQKDLDKEKFDKAINHYKQAWKHAQKAINSNMNMEDEDEDDD